MVIGSSRGATALGTPRWARMRWLVLAPHPDDETLGAGALIAQTARTGRLGGIVYLTDGSGSHPDEPRVKHVRRREARLAVRRLAGQAAPIRWIGWQDARPYKPGESRFARDASALGALLRRSRIDAVAVTARWEEHCDHEAAYHLARAAIKGAKRSIRLFQYHVWSKPGPPARAIVRTQAMDSGRRRLALAAHRSQLGPAYGPGFRLPQEKFRMPAQDTLFLYGPNA